MLFFSKVSEGRIINLEHVSMVTIEKEVDQAGTKSVVRLVSGSWIDLDVEETKQLLDDMDHAATLYRIQQNIQSGQEH